MSFVIYIFLAVCLFNQDAIDRAGKSDSIRKVTSTFHYNEKRYDIIYGPDDLKKTPRWNPLEGEPPFKISNAIKVANKYFNKHVDNYVNWNIESVEMSLIGENRWIYEFEYRCDRVACGNDSFYKLVVKMDGTVIEPLISTKEQ